MLNRIDYYLLDQSKGMARIQLGQVPDGSGGPIGGNGELEDYFFLPGRSGGQKAYFDTADGGGGFLSSTSAGTKGFIFFGDGLLSMYDEENIRFGLNVTPEAELHIKATAVGGSTTLVPSSDIDQTMTAYTGTSGTSTGNDAFDALDNDDDYTLYLGNIATQNPTKCGLSGVVPNTLTEVTINYKSAWFSTPSLDAAVYKFHVVNEDGDEWVSPSIPDETTVPVNPAAFGSYSVTIDMSGAPTSTGNTANAVWVEGPNKAVFWLCTYVEVVFTSGQDIVRISDSGDTVRYRIDSDMRLGVGTSTDDLTSLITLKTDANNSDEPLLSIFPHSSQTANLITVRDFTNTYNAFSIDAGSLVTVSETTATDDTVRFQIRVPTTQTQNISQVVRAYSGVVTIASAPTAGGTGYTAGDILTITTGGTGATVQVSTVGGGGVVTALVTTPLTRGTGYTTGTGKVTTGGTGTGCTVNITVVAGNFTAWSIGSTGASVYGDNTVNAPDVIRLRINQGSGQSVDMFQIRNTADTVSLAKADSGGCWDIRPAGAALDVTTPSLKILRKSAAAAPIQEWANTSGTAQARVDASGRIIGGVSAISATHILTSTGGIIGLPSSIGGAGLAAIFSNTVGWSGQTAENGLWRLEPTLSDPTSAGGPGVLGTTMFRINATVSDAAAMQTGLQSNVTISDDSAIGGGAGEALGLDFNANSSGTGDVTTLGGVIGTTLHDSSGTVGTIFGASFTVRGSGGNIADALGFKGDCLIDSGTMTAYTGLYLGMPTVSGTGAVTTAISLYTEYKGSGITNPFAIVSGSISSPTLGHPSKHAGNFYIGRTDTTPTARLHLESGSTSAGTAPIKKTSGSLMSAVEAGTEEYDGSYHYLTNATTRGAVCTTANVVVDGDGNVVTSDGEILLAA